MIGLTSGLVIVDTVNCKSLLVEVDEIDLMGKLHMHEVLIRIVEVTVGYVYLVYYCIYCTIICFYNNSLYNLS